MFNSFPEKAIDLLVPLIYCHR